MLETIVNFPLYFIIALGILVFVHELGHFLVAKKAGIRVERFSLGFPPKMFGIQIGETEYCLSWIPFGGYVKVAGMADVGADAATGEPWEFPSKPIWVRMAVIFAGPLMNFIFAFFAYAFIFLYFGIDTVESTTVAPMQDSLSAAAGIRERDRILSVDGTPVQNGQELWKALGASSISGAQVELERDGQILLLELPPVGEKGYGLKILAPALVGSLEPGLPAEQIGLRQGDRITTVAGEPVHNWDQMSTVIRRYPGQLITIAWEREGMPMQAEIAPVERIRGDKTIGMIGIGPHTFRTPVGLGEAVVLGAEGVYNASWLILDFLAELSQGNRSTEELGGPLRIAQIAQKTAEQGFSPFVYFLAMLSVNLAIINLLPIPVLDGGHLTFLTLEAIMGRPLSLRQRELSQQIGLAIMLSLMILVTFNDLNQMLFHHIADFFQ